MKDKLTISLIEEKDILTIVKIVNDAYQGGPGSKSWTSESHLVEGLRTTEANVTHLLSQPGTNIFKCINTAGEILGCVVLEKKSDTLYLGMLSVAPDAQTAGIGGTLIKYGEAFAREYGLNSITITVIDRRKELIDWYLRKGFLFTGHQVPFSNSSSTSSLPLNFVELRKTFEGQAPQGH